MRSTKTWSPPAGCRWLFSVSDSDHIDSNVRAHDNADASADRLIVRHLGVVDYLPVWRAMQDFTQRRDAETPDELWLLQHPPVFTQGQVGKAEHVLAPGDIPVIQVDRGGQVTYHGPGQLVGYLLINLKRRHLGVRDLVTTIEQVLVKVLAELDIDACPRADAPGVYVKRAGATDANKADAKIAQLGLRVRRGCSFHGLSLNIDMDMEPFLRINPCGHAGLDVTSIALQTGATPDFGAIADRVSEQFIRDLGYTARSDIRDGCLP